MTPDFFNGLIAGAGCTLLALALLVAGFRAGYRHAVALHRLGTPIMSYDPSPLWFPRHLTKE